ncbi:hypothetical protein [uncultured Kocuria sp.]|uniref:hypothetical protein n=1 Tax=uncultured Kocuria sp. TaxID=259305 RepID=UPI00259684A1|nr:hypothetical protein [uncultured Kocuria sp.]MCT1368009.1 hypothetical protein [Rothia sp. p3-SID1597]
MNNDEPLECGRTVESVMDTKDSVPDEHQRACPHCSDLRDRLQQLDRMTDAAQREDRSLTMTSQARERVLNFARSTLRRGADIPVHRDDDATVSFSQLVISRTAREIVDAHPGLMARRCTVTGSEDPADGLQPLTLRIGLTVSPTFHFQDLDDVVRPAIRDIMSSKLGAHVADIELSVEDVLND